MHIQGANKYSYQLYTDNSDGLVQKKGQWDLRSPYSSLEMVHLPE